MAQKSEGCHTKKKKIYIENTYKINKNVINYKNGWPLGLSHE